MLNDSQIITVDSTPYTHDKVSPGENRSIYKTADGTRKITVSHQESSNRARRLARIDVTKVAADPISAVNVSKTLGFYVVIDEPDFGFSATEIANEIAGFQAWLTSAMVADILSGQH